MKSRTLILLPLLLAACTKQSSSGSNSGSGSATTAGSGSAAIAPITPPPPPPNDGRIRVPPNPPAVATIAFECSHSDMPFGNGSQYSSTVYNLDTATWTSDTANTPSTKDPEPTPPPPGSKDAATDRTKREHTTGTIPPAKVDLLRAAVAKVLSGGPYEPEYPVPEGVSCHLALAAAGAAPFLVVDKANREKKDAVNALLDAL